MGGMPITQEILMTESIHKMISVGLVKESENLTDQEKRVKRSASYYHRNKDKLWTVAELFKGKIEVQSATVEENCFDLNVAGDKHTLDRSCVGPDVLY